jgi:hypothetical protein
MESNEVLQNQLFEIIKNQIKDNRPPETKITYERLISSGYSELETKQLIGQCVAVEIFDVIKKSKPFNEKRYIRNLKKLPEIPSE